ncbi:MAG TPA: FAD-dependent oxidoreductase [Fibrobacteria bacterium]|nr:FAD-dependent oxidoreductase [Fibrobacteria bacterium]
MTQSPGSLSRRDFVKGALALGAATLIPGCKTSSKSGTRPRIAIVGAGIAGLSAAHALAKGGIDADLYEAGARAGGRIMTLQNIVAPGLFTEAGGEFIDTAHADMLALAREFGLEIQDAFGPGFSGLIESAWHFGGRMRSEAEVAQAVRELTAAIQADIGALPDGIRAGTGGLAAELDALSLEEYLDGRGVTGWLRSLLIAAYVSEFGLDAGRQSCLNLLTLVSLDTSAGKFRVYGESDERYRIAGGNQALTDALAGKYRARLRLDHRLEAVSAQGEGYKLSFQGPGGAVEKPADAVILALPFTLLRAVDLRLELPAAKRKAIAELGYGTNSKLFLGFSSRPWRKAGYGGDFFTDDLIQCGWDHAKVQAGTAGGLTIFQGGSAGLALAAGGPAAQAAAMAGPLEAVFPGTKAARNGNVGAFHWPTYPLSLGSYACYLPGQWTSIAGEEAKPVGNLFFAGEHCSPDFQGYMNGGAATGREAAEAVLAKWAPGKKAG